MPDTDDPINTASITWSAASLDGEDLAIFDFFGVETVEGVDVVGDFVTAWEITPSEYDESGGTIHFDVTGAIDSEDGSVARFAVLSNLLDPDDELVAGANSILQITKD